MESWSHKLTNIIVKFVQIKEGRMILICQPKSRLLLDLAALSRWDLNVFFKVTTDHESRQTSLNLPLING